MSYDRHIDFFPNWRIFFYFWHFHYALLVHDVPRSCHIYLVQNVLAPEFLPIKTELMSRYTNFYRSVSTSASFELCLLSKIVCKDVRSTTKRNLSFIEHETSLDPCTASPQEVKSSVIPNEVPRNQHWRLNLLQNLLDERREKNSLMEDTKIISHMIDSLCSSWQLWGSYTCNFEPIIYLYLIMLTS